MANRENQGIQIALIIFVIITVVLCVFTYFFYSQSESRGKELAQAKQQLETSRDSIDLLQNKILYLKYYIGMPDVTKTQLEGLRTDEELDKIIAKYDADMKMYGEGLEPDKLNYSSLPEYLIASLRQKNIGITDANNLRLAAEADRDRTKTDETAKTAAAIAARDKSVNDLASVQTAINAERDKYKSETQKIHGDLLAKTSQFEEFKDKQKTEAENLQEENTRLTALSDGLKGQLAKTKQEAFDLADGKITLVNQRQSIVWINLGSADGLRPQVTFSVYDHNANGVVNEESKARIEVTKIEGPNQSRCRILEDELENPILPDDKIYTPAWQSGRRLHFAIAGKLDIDGDGKSDNAQIRRIIALNGGVVDLELKEDGTVEGEMSVNTRYLLVDEQQADAEGLVNQNQKSLRSEIIKEANLFGADMMGVDKFLEYMGWKAKTQTVPLGRRLGSAAPAAYGSPQDAVPTTPARGDDGAF